MRSPAKLPFADDVTVVAGDVYTGTGVAEAVAGADAVVSVLGQTDGSPDDLLTVAGDNVLAAMTDAGVDRYVTLVGAGVRQEGDSVSLGGRAMGVLLKLFARSVLEDAAAHVDRVKRTDLAWTVVRAPRLTERAPTGEYRAGDVSLGFESIDRADVARFILDCLEEDLYVRELPTVGPT
ncbi:NAD(P)-dependent oxidoreductase [Natrinema gelatinilyticum]|uniref:NAD(P)-dependent oxidoreductase n=1 Tax=Natrinema gelatinilyticum TaxID=2961571 RepID=UPI0020C43D36|nr:NAD(P)H-binding protein [Natrinema gelatinilyticum]